MSAASSNPTHADDALANAHHEQVPKKAGVWDAIAAASSNSTDTDNVLANLRQQVHDAFAHNGGHASNAVDDLAALLHFTHHE